MLNYTENAHTGTTIPFLPVLCIQNQEGITQPPPEMTQKQGQEAGQGYAQTLLDAARTDAPEPPAQSADLQPEVLPALETFTFRKAVIKTESTAHLADGIVCGQACTVDLIDDETSVTSKDLADLFTEIMNSDEPEAFNVGFIIGLVDALLCARKTYPCGW